MGIQLLHRVHNSFIYLVNDGIKLIVSTIFPHPIWDDNPVFFENWLFWWISWNGVELRISWIFTGWLSNIYIYIYIWLYTINVSNQVCLIFLQMIPRSREYLTRISRVWDQICHQLVPQWFSPSWFLQLKFPHVTFPPAKLPWGKLTQMRKTDGFRKRNIYKCWVSTSILVYKSLFSSYVIMFLDFSYGFFLFPDVFPIFPQGVWLPNELLARRATPQDADSCDCNAPEPAGVARVTWTNMELHRPRCVNKCI